MKRREMTSTEKLLDLNRTPHIHLKNASVIITLIFDLIN